MKNAPGVDQYSLAKILTIWAMASVPMPILAFVVAPAISPQGGTRLLLTTWLLLIGGMVWQFILSILILWREVNIFNWSQVKQRIWLQRPHNPRTGKASYKYFGWLIPALLFYVAMEESPVAELFGSLILIPLPFLADVSKLDLRDLTVPELVGAWWLMGVAIVSCVFNYILGEELLFRGILLPKMRGAFGKWDWFANSVLFALYHLHRPTQALGYILGGCALSFPSRHFRSIWFSIILHGLEGTFVLAGVFMVVSGFAF